jgi:hypothetical protein
MAVEIRFGMQIAKCTEMNLMPSVRKIGIWLCMARVQGNPTDTNASFRVSQLHEFGGRSTAIHRRLASCQKTVVRNAEVIGKTMPDANLLE